MLTRFDASDDELIDDIRDFLVATAYLTPDEAEHITMDILDIIRDADVS